ncbi:hypothetical protein B0H21DRAFT_40001 [Amylocystis lapponica]|nr:hypothetical protein B0H21DRAFT_40001 [Amylocystis lapponica]
MSRSSQELRPQAGPLPSKRGEIGYEEGVHGSTLQPEQSSSEEAPLPERHPADTPLHPAAPPSSSAPADTTASSGTRSSSPTNASIYSTSKNSFIAFLKPKRLPPVYGLRIATLVVFFLQVVAVCATVAGWVLIIRHIQNDPSATSSTTMGAGGAQIFVFVGFAIMVIAQLIFLERTLYDLRAQRYCFLHPGAVLPRHAHRPAPPRPGMAFVPWNRPPLPTYAAALSQSGYGTGDVEDNIIAVPPPPAYGNTRGSTLLLANFLGGRTRSARNSAVSHNAQETVEVARPDRPMSYRSYDPEWEELRDANTAAVLEETLTRMEEGDVTEVGSLHAERS